WLQARRRAAAAGLAEALAAEERAAAAARQAFGRAQALAELSRQDHRARRHGLAREAEARLE
ncbi:hypothetical protein, partial [Frigidibacter oleivorans]|uniref:hypothetical protein n=1 Tax=Frigidibacter oleivorans TaxID=2487129 RepID=UPI00197AE0A6